MYTSVYDASPPRGSDSSSAQTHHGAASAAQSPAGAAAHMEKGGASERTPAAREINTGVDYIKQRNTHYRQPRLTKTTALRVRNTFLIIFTRKNYRPDKCP